MEFLATDGVKQANAGVQASVAYETNDTQVGASFG